MTKTTLLAGVLLLIACNTPKPPDSAVSPGQNTVGGACAKNEDSATGQPGSQRAEKQLNDLGENLVWVEAGGRNIAGVRTGTHTVTTLTMDDARAIVAEVRLIKAASPNIDGNVQVIYGSRNWGTRY